jgi:hypothetical protein
MNSPFQNTDPRPLSPQAGRREDVLGSAVSTPVGLEEALGETGVGRWTVPHARGTMDGGRGGLQFLSVTFH